MSPMNNRRMTPMAEPGVLDFAPGAAAAYSLRNLSYTYAGPVVTVRRSTDDAEADFTASEVSDGTLAAWCGGGDGFVKVWHDQSQYGRDASNSTAVEQPKIVDSGVLVTEGGKAAVQFDGVDDWLSLASEIDPHTQWSVFAVTKKHSLGVKGITVANATSAAVAYPFYDFSDNLLYTRNSTGFGSVSNPDVEQFLYSAINQDDSSTSGLRLFRDAAALNLSLSTLGGATSNWNSIGRRLSEYGRGTISELIIYPTDQTALRTRIEGNIAWTYNA